ncbi:MAG: BREX system Lon protease-like protein BrxL [Methanophagales archaeon]|nr:BREX system Lon protease-like protein BrxL [Methanophagales archaeon]
MNPEVYTQRQKLILISRFVPLVENNVNMIEFGPRATGKTYFYRNISFYTRIYSGGVEHLLSYFTISSIVASIYPADKKDFRLNPYRVFGVNGAKPRY